MQKIEDETRNIFINSIDKYINYNKHGLQKTIKFNHII